jgi:hypothetical protein
MLLLFLLMVTLCLSILMIIERRLYVHDHKNACGALPCILCTEVYVLAYSERSNLSQPELFRKSVYIFISCAPDTGSISPTSGGSVAAPYTGLSISQTGNDIIRESGVRLVFYHIYRYYLNVTNEHPIYCRKLHIL